MKYYLPKHITTSFASLLVSIIHTKKAFKISKYNIIIQTLNHNKILKVNFTR